MLCRRFLFASNYNNSSFTMMRASPSPTLFFSTTAALLSTSFHFQSTAAATSSSSSATATTKKVLTDQQKASRAKTAALKMTGYANLHKSTLNISKQRVALQVWREIEELPEECIDHADADTVIKMMTAFAYFRKIWENGHDGPANPLPKRDVKMKRKSAEDPDEVEIPQEFYFVSQADQQEAHRRKIGSTPLSSDGPARGTQKPKFGSNSSASVGGDRSLRGGGTSGSSSRQQSSSARAPPPPVEAESVGDMIE